MNKTIYNELKSVVEKNKEKVILADENKEITYRSLLDNINILSKSFCSIDVKYNTIVNVCLENCIEAVYTIFALNKIGATINYINYDLNFDNIIENNVLIISNKLYIENIDLINNKNLVKIIILDGVSNNDDIINFNDFMDISKYYNKTIKRDFNSEYIMLINYFENKRIEVTEECLINSIDNFSKFNIKLDTILNVNPFYNYIGFNLSLIIPILNGNKVILCNSKELYNHNNDNKFNSLIGTTDLFYNISKNKYDIKNIKNTLLIYDIVDDYKLDVIYEYFKNNNIVVNKYFGLNEIVNIVNKDDIVIKDVLKNKILDDNSIGNLFIKNNSLCNIYENNKLIKMNKAGFYSSNYVGNIVDDNINVIDTLDKEIVRCNMYKTGLASIDMPWLKYFPEESRNEKVAELTLYEYLKKVNVDNYLELAIKFYNTEIKYFEMFNNIEKCAKSLKALGIKKGEYVSLCLPSMPEFIYLFYAISKIGAVACLIEPRTPASRIKSYLEVSKSKYIFMVDLCKKNIDKIIDMEQIKNVISISPMESVKDKKIKYFYNLTNKNVKTCGKYVSYKDFITMGESIGEFESCHYVKNTTAAIVYTSGTTGIPKGACLTNETFNGQNMQLKYSGMCPKPGQIFLSNVPFTAAYGCSSGMHNALSSGVTISIIMKYKPKDFPKLIYDNKANHVMGVPRFYELLADSKKYSKKDFSFLTNPVSGGDKMSTNREYYVNDFMKKVNCVNLKKGLGMSEFGGGFITTVNNEVNKVGSVGIPHVGNNVMIIDPETKKEINYGREHNIGELYVNSLTVMKEYLHREEETNNFFYIDELGIRWAKTGDLVYMDEDGVIFFVDRIKNVIMRPDGHTVPLSPIENAIDKSEFIETCAVVGATAEEGRAGKYPMAYIVLKNDVDKPNNEVHNEILKLINLYLPSREQPTWYRYVEKLPYNMAGKVDMLKLGKMSEEDQNKNVKVLFLKDK